eukprot:1084472-Prymnesium_polylepis.1
MLAARNADFCGGVNTFGPGFHRFYYRTRGKARCPIRPDRHISPGRVGEAQARNRRKRWVCVLEPAHV